MKTNEHLTELVQELKKQAIEKEVPLFKRLASDLEKSTRSRRVVNLNRIDRYTKENDFIVVPGKVLGSGDINHKVTVAAYQFSNTALDKLNGAQAKILSINDLMKDEIKGKRIRILG